MKFQMPLHLIRFQLHKSTTRKLLLERAATENIQLFDGKTGISPLFLLRRRFKGYHSESDVKILK